jgi:hypothetical protein
MSYCRGEVYAYRSHNGWCIHVGREEDIDDRRYHFETSPQAFRERLWKLMEEGFAVPQSAIDRIDREIAEGKWNKAP